MSWLLDTNVISEMRRPRPNLKVLDFVASNPADRVFISVVSIAEVRFGIEIASDAAKRSDLQHWLDRIVRPMFAGRVLDVTEDVLLRSRLMLDHGRRQRQTYPFPDVLIAATASHHDLTIATRNVADFETMGVPVLNPWTAEP